MSEKAFEEALFIFSRVVNNTPHSTPSRAETHCEEIFGARSLDTLGHSVIHVASAGRVVQKMCWVPLRYLDVSGPVAFSSPSPAAYPEKGYGLRQQSLVALSPLFGEKAFEEALFSRVIHVPLYSVRRPHALRQNMLWISLDTPGLERNVV